MLTPAIDVFHPDQICADKARVNKNNHENGEIVKNCFQNILCYPFHVV